MVTGIDEGKKALPPVADVSDVDVGDTLVTGADTIPMAPTGLNPSTRVTDYLAGRGEVGFENKSTDGYGRITKPVSSGPISAGHVLAERSANGIGIPKPTEFTERVLDTFQPGKIVTAAMEDALALVLKNIIGTLK